MAAPGSTQHRPGDLPHEVSGFVGRRDGWPGSAVLLAAPGWSRSPVPGGSARRGSRCAPAAAPAGEFARRRCLVELAGLRDPAAAAHRRDRASGCPRRTPGTQLAAVLAHLRDRQLLLILDTCEHLMDACAALAETVVRETPASPCSPPAGSRWTCPASTPA